MKSKTLSIFLNVIACTFLSACSKNGSDIVFDYSDTGLPMLDIHEKNDGVTTIFFDDDNVVNEDGTAFTRPKRQVTRTIGSSDCYMVKSGNVELLVDGGYQSITSYGAINQSYVYNDEYVKIECQENLLKKIASVISSDGVLDYLIVTHGDYDHIAALIVNGGIFDAFFNKKTITTFDGREVTFNKINYIIDFDSGLVKNFSDKELEKATRLVRSDYYQSYIYQRNLLIQNGTSYCPASAFFNSDILRNKGTYFSKDEKNSGMPDSIVNKLEQAPSGVGVQYILDEFYDNQVKTTKDSEYINEDILDDEVGSITKTLSVTGEPKYYYSLKFNDAELRILYNWHYDYIYNSSFNRNSSDDDSTQMTDPSNNIYDSQDANNISVCFEIVKNNFKFLSLGDLGGDGENGLLKYYENTSVLTQTTVFKLSHHGSVKKTDLTENSEKLFSILKPKIIVGTCCASFKKTEWKNSGDDPVMSALVGRPTTKQRLFTSISSAYSDTNIRPLIMFTNINCCRSQFFESLPFYGDIKISFNCEKLHVSTSYCGNINAYISQKWNSDYYHDNNEEFSFRTRKNKKLLSVEETDWFTAIGFNFGGV